MTGPLNRKMIRPCCRCRLTTCGHVDFAAAWAIRQCSDTPTIKHAKQGQQTLLWRTVQCDQALLYHGQVADNLPLYGVCCYMEEMVHRAACTPEPPVPRSQCAALPLPHLSAAVLLLPHPLPFLPTPLQGADLALAPRDPKAISKCWQTKRMLTYYRISHFLAGALHPLCPAYESPGLKKVFARSRDSSKFVTAGAGEGDARCLYIG